MHIKPILVLFLILSGGMLLGQRDDAAATQLDWMQQYTNQQLDDIATAQQNKPSTLAAIALYRGRKLHAMGQPTEVLSHLRTLEQYVAASADSSLYGKQMLLYGMYYDQLDLPNQALPYFQAAAAYEAIHAPPLALTTVYQLMAGVYSNMQRYPEAKTYLRQALDIARDAEHAFTEEILLTELSGTCYLQQQYDSVVYYAHPAMEVAQSIGDSAGVVYAGIKLMKTYYRTEAVAAAQQIAKATDVWLPANDALLRFDYQVARSDVERLIGADLRAIQLLEEAKTYLPVDVWHTRHYEADRRLYELYEKRANYSQALYHLKQTQMVTDSFYNAEQRRKFESLRVAYEVEQKENAITQLKQTNAIKDLEIRQRTLMGIGGALLLLILGSVYYFYSRQQMIRSQQQQLELEQQLQRARLKPHFIFNALNAIREVVSQQDTQQAETYLIHFSQAMRAMLEYTAEEFITLEEELAFIDHYLQLQQLRLGKKFQYQIDQPEAAGQILVPAMITQPLVENAVEYGDYQKKEQPLLVQVKLQSDECIIQITNPAKSGSTASAQPYIHRSFGLEISQKRLDYLCQREQQNFGLEGPIFTDQSTTVKLRLAMLLA